jgi:hypothetical protein
MIVSVSGLIGSGKDTVASYLVNNHGFKRMSFAASLKDAVSVIFSWDRELLDGVTRSSREWREQPDEWWSNRLGMDITPRWVLQYWGTDVLRKHFHDDIWISSLEAKLAKTSDDVVITDARFKNEIDAIRRLDGIAVCVQRGIIPHWYDIAIQANRGQQQAVRWLQDNKIHASEYSHVGLEYNRVLSNNGSIDELNSQVSQLLSHRVSR